MGPNKQILELASVLQEMPYATIEAAYEMTVHASIYLGVSGAGMTHRESRQITMAALCWLRDRDTSIAQETLRLIPDVDLQASSESIRSYHMACLQLSLMLRDLTEARPLAPLSRRLCYAATHICRASALIKGEEGSSEYRSRFNREAAWQAECLRSIYRLRFTPTPGPRSRNSLLAQ